MKMKFFLTLAVIIVFTAISAYSQTDDKSNKINNYQVLAINDSTNKDDEDEVPEKIRYYKEKYEEKYKEEFQIVWKAIKMSVDEISCLLATDNNKQNDDGTFQGVLKTDFCVLAQGDDTTKFVLQRYSLKVPYIMGGLWINGRIQYTFIVKEQADGYVNLVLRAEMSGMEDYVTHEVHFWKSNGILEHQMIERIAKNIKKQKEK
jgi:hypothetical protein